MTEGIVVRGLIAASVLSAALAGEASAGPGQKGHSHDTFAAGEPGNPKNASRVIEVEMREGNGSMSYFPAIIQVTRGEQIRFVLKNVGELKHEFMLDTVEANRKHAIAMQKNPEMEHADPNGHQIDPKKSGELLWRFTKLGTYEFACLHPGHYEGGMKGVIVVAEQGKTTAKAQPK